MIELIRNLLIAPSADVMAQRELEEARRELLEAQTAHEWAKSRVDFNLSRIRRLEARQAESTKGAA